MVIETSRLLLRCWSLDDLEPFHAVCSDPRVMEYVGSGQPWSRSRTLEMIETAMATRRQHGYCRWAVILKPVVGSVPPTLHTRPEERLAQQERDPVASPADPLIGFCGFVPAEGGAEIGWRLGAAHWGQGLATEAARATLQYGFETLRFPRVIATIQAGNAASRRVAEKLGMNYTHSFERAGREILVFAATPPVGDS